MVVLRSREDFLSINISRLLDKPVTFIQLRLQRGLELGAGKVPEASLEDQGSVERGGLFAPVSPLKSPLGSVKGLGQARAMDGW